LTSRGSRLKELGSRFDFSWEWIKGAGFKKLPLLVDTDSNAASTKSESRHTKHCPWAVQIFSTSEMSRFIFRGRLNPKTNF
jgi:hypothetical protein